MPHPHQISRTASATAPSLCVGSGQSRRRGRPAPERHNSRKVYSRGQDDAHPVVTAVGFIKVECLKCMHSSFVCVLLVACYCGYLENKFYNLKRVLILFQFTTGERA